MTRGLTNRTVTATGEHQAPIHNIIGKAVVDACVRAGKQGRKFRVIIVIPAVPGFAGDLRQDAAAGTRAIMDYQYKSINRGEHSIMEQIKAEGVDPSEHIFVFNLRTYDRLNTTPALKEQLDKAGVSYKDVQNAGNEEVSKIDSVRAMESNSSANSASSSDSEDIATTGDKIGLENPKLEKFEEKRGEVNLEQEENIVSKNTIAQNAMANTPANIDEPWAEGSEAEELEKDNFIQEELYVHAKLLIVDDQTVVVGSSNINDRSQNGDHDSELSIVIEDSKTMDSTMDGQPYTAANFATTLRRRLWREHLGLLQPQDYDNTDKPNAQPVGDCENENDEGDEWFEFVADPLGEEVWNMWTEQATTNTKVFRELFHADPDDSSEYL